MTPNNKSCEQRPAHGEINQLNGLKQMKNGGWKQKQCESTHTKGQLDLLRQATHGHSN